MPRNGVSNIQWILPFAFGMESYVLEYWAKMEFPK